MLVNVLQRMLVESV